VNGVLQHSWNLTQYRERCFNAAYNNYICVLWNDEERALKKEQEDVEFAVRMAEEGGRQAVMGITHVYYA